MKEKPFVWELGKEMKVIDISKKKYMWMEIVQRKGRAVVYGYDYYPPSSVLAGQYRRNFIESYDCSKDGTRCVFSGGITEAEEAYPEAGLGHELLQPENSFNHLEGDDE